MSFETPITLQLITDVGISHGNGVDSTQRAKRQYNKLGVALPDVVSAGHSPLHVAFAACSRLSPEDESKTDKTLELLGLGKVAPSPVALNSSPRTKKVKLPNGQEDYIYRLITGDDERFLIYGPQVVQWVIAFNKEIKRIDKIISIGDIIPDTSNGSQYRSAANLPEVQLLEYFHQLEINSVIEEVNPDSIPQIYDQQDGDILVVPPDEYGNGRFITTENTVNAIRTREEITIPGISDQIFKVRESLTDIIAGELSVWQSSNYLPNDGLRVWNIGTKWSEDTTRTTDPATLALSAELSKRVGEQHTIDWE